MLTLCERKLNLSNAGEGENDFSLILDAAEQGDVRAQYHLGLMYSNGDGVAQNYCEAVEWFLKAAEQGYARAQCELELMYSRGYGVAQDYCTVRRAFWHDPFIEELDAKAKLLYLYLFTCPYANNLGVVETTRKKISFETSLSTSEIEKYIKEFEVNGKIVCDKDHNLILICDFIRHQCSTNPRILEGQQKIAPEIPSPVISKALCIRYPEVYGVNKEDGDTVSIPYANGSHTLCVPSVEIGNCKMERGKRKEEEGRPQPPDCPHGKIREMYHDILPMLPRTNTWEEPRQELLRARWRETWDRLRQKDLEHDEASLLEWWKKYFARVRASPFLTGKEKGNNGNYFIPDLEWLVRPKNFAKVLDDFYRDRSQAKTV